MSMPSINSCFPFTELSKLRKKIELNEDQKYSSTFASLCVAKLYFKIGFSLHLETSDVSF